MSFATIPKTAADLRKVTVPASQSIATVMMSPASQLYSTCHGSQVSSTDDEDTQRKYKLPICHNKLQSPSKN